MGLWWYNNVKRHWHNFRWWLYTVFDADVRAQLNGRRFVAYEAALTPADIEWAKQAFEAADLEDGQFAGEG